MTELHKKKNTEEKGCRCHQWPFEGKTAVFTCIKRASLFFVGFAVGSWNQNTCRLLISQLQDAVQQPTYKQKLGIYSDGNDDYATVLPEYFHKDSLCYGQFIKHRERKKVVYTYKRKVFGNPALQDIHTNEVECFNSVLRGKVSRLVRRCKEHAKAKKGLANALGFLRWHWNFKHRRNGTTPAMQEGITHKAWGWRTFLYFQLTDIS